MNYILYVFVFVPLNLIGSLIAYPLAVVLPLLAKDRPGPADNGMQWQVGPWLPTWLSWFQTPDNNLYGDSTFRNIHGTTYIAMVKWLMRNPFYGFELKYFDSTKGVTSSGNLNITEGDKNHPGVEGHLLVKSQDKNLFQYVVVKRIFKTGKCFYFNFGWNIRQVLNPAWVNDPWYPHNLANVEATFVFSPRVVNFTA